MFELTIDARFSAAHAIRINGVPEPIHGHDWLATVCVAGETLDENGLLVDFHTIEDALKECVGRFHNRCLNEVPPFDKTNPTAELVARHIGQTIRQILTGDVTLLWARVTEAPGCAAIWKP